MEQLIHSFLTPAPIGILLVIIAISFAVLSKGADMLVDEAVSLSLRWNVPKMIIGATIVSIGTTLPEATVSVFAAIKGNPGLALGNAIGSIIVDTGLILGVAALIGKLAIDKLTINRQGRIQVAAGFLLAIVSLPFLSRGPEGRITQWMGFILIALLIVYIIGSIRWAQQCNVDVDFPGDENHSSLFIQLLKLAIGIALVIFASKVLIPSVEITAVRAGIPQSIVAATLVAFGTSLPELITAVMSVRKGHGELAVGNIVGADILNILFVIGTSAAVTSGGLIVPTEFYKLQIPFMLIKLLIFRILAKKNRFLGRKEGGVLLGLYLIYLVLNFTFI